MDEIKIRTDLALETKENLESSGRIKGVIFDERYDEDTGIKISRLEILNKDGEKAMGRGKGEYYTFETGLLSENDGDYHREVSELLAEYLRKIVRKNLLSKNTPYHILVAGLGNREATPDALGPWVVGNLAITEPDGVNPTDGEKKFAYVRAIAPGVMAQTGMETADILRGVIHSLKPEAMIVIDALAARSTTRLANTIQLSDTGIMPGSGVGNHRNAIDKENMGIPVIAVGVPTVVDAATIVGDAIERLLSTEFHEPDSNKKSPGGEIRSMKKVIDSFNSIEKRQFMRELMPDNMSGMYVTPKDVDETVKRISYTISEAINICMQGEILRKH